MDLVERLTITNCPSALHPWLDELNELYQMYLKAMDYKRRRAELSRLELARAWAYVAWAWWRDGWFNLTTAADIFDDPAREWTFTARLKRYRRRPFEYPAETVALAEFLCDQVLDQGDPDGNHC